MLEVGTKPVSPSTATAMTQVEMPLKKPVSSGAGQKPLGHYKVDVLENNALIDVSDWPLECLLAPNVFLPAPLAKLIEEAIKSHTSNLKKLLKEKSWVCTGKPQMLMPEVR